MAKARTQPDTSEIDELKALIRKPGSTEHAKIGIYGRNGGGKTRLAGSFPKVLLLDINEEGDRSIKGVTSARVLPVSRWEQIGNAYWYLKSGEHPFETVSLDTTTEMQACAMSFVLAEAENRDPTREKQMPDPRTYGRAGQLMRSMLMAYRNLPMHVVLIAQERTITDQDTGEITEICPDLPGSSRGTFMGSVGVLGRMVPQQDKVRRDGKVVKVWRDHMKVGPHEYVKTKDRTNLIGAEMVNPTGPKLIDIWNQ